MSIFLSLIILISLCSGSAFAAGEDEKSLSEENNEEWIITEMSALDEAVMNQTVPQLVEGSEQTEPVLPETLEAMAYQMEEEPQAARTPAALTAAMAVINERREIFFMENSFDKSMILWSWQLVSNNQPQSILSNSLSFVGSLLTYRKLVTLANAISKYSPLFSGTR